MGVWNDRLDVSTLPAPTRLTEADTCPKSCLPDMYCAHTPATLDLRGCRESPVGVFPTPQRLPYAGYRRGESRTAPHCGDCYPAPRCGAHIPDPLLQLLRYSRWP